jgi:hypothetical protein
VSCPSEARKWQNGSFLGEGTLITNTRTTKENGTVIFLEQFEGKDMKLEELRLECNAIFKKRTSS